MIQKGLIPGGSFSDSQEMEYVNKAIDRMFRLFGDSFVFKDKGAANNYSRSPVYYVDETDTEYLLKLELPGVKKEDIKLNIKGNGLELMVESKVEKEDKKTKSYYASAGRFHFYEALPDNVDVEKISSEYKDGILEVKLPKVAYEPPKSLEIKIK